MPFVTHVTLSNYLPSLGRVAWAGPNTAQLACFQAAATWRQHITGCSSVPSRHGCEGCIFSGVSVGGSPGLCTVYCAICINSTVGGPSLKRLSCCRHSVANCHQPYCIIRLRLSQRCTDQISETLLPCRGSARPSKFWTKLS